MGVDEWIDRLRLGGIEVTRLITAWLAAVITFLRGAGVATVVGNTGSATMVIRGCGSYVTLQSVSAPGAIMWHMQATKPLRQRYQYPTMPPGLRLWERLQVIILRPQFLPRGKAGPVTSHLDAATLLEVTRRLAMPLGIG